MPFLSGIEGGHGAQRDLFARWGGDVKIFKICQAVRVGRSQLHVNFIGFGSHLNFFGRFTMKGCAKLNEGDLS